MRSRVRIPLWKKFFKYKIKNIGKYFFLVPERLRKLLRDTEADGAVVDIPTETIKKEKSEILPQTTTKNTTTTTTKLAEATKQIKKRNVGRPRKYPRKEETNNNNNNIEQHKQQEKQQQQTKEETQKQINNNNHNTNNINCFKGKIWGKRRPNRFVLCFYYRKCLF